MGKREGSYVTPVDDYRKNIGNNETKKNKKATEALRNDAHKRNQSSSALTDSVIIIGICLLLLATVYYLFFFGVTSKNQDRQLRGMI